jgi:uncharacterized iron-regulated protein
MSTMSLRSLVNVAGIIIVAAAVVHGQSAYVPERVFDSARGQFGDFEAMLADVARADVVFVGELHDDANTHRLELAVLQGLARRRDHIILALEMFERDVQEPLDHFSMGHMTDDEFAKVSRPWPAYATDYKPLVDFAIAKTWPVVASNVPRSFASQVAASGLDALKTKSTEEQKWFARDLSCPTDDDYFKRFEEAMGGHPAGPPGANAAAASSARQRLERTYFAQCLKDETMAESVAGAWQAGAIGGPRPLVVHVNGAFHSDFGEGTAARAVRRLPGKRVAVISIQPVEDLDKLAPDATERKRADYLVYTIK